LQIQAGSLNGTEGLPWSQVSALQSDARGQLSVLPQQQIYFMVLNLTRPPFDDLKVRQAMSLALDRQVFVDRATAGQADVANSFMPKSGLCWNANAKLPYDLAQAKALIAQSKYPTGFSGAKLQLTSGAQVGRDNAVLAKDMWDKIGINLTIEEVEGSTLSKSSYAADFDAISGYQWTNGMVDPEQHVIFMFIDPKLNTGYEPSQHAVDLVKAASQELDPQKRCGMYNELQDIYNEDVGGSMTLYYTPSLNYLSPDVRGFMRTPLGVPLYKQTWLAK
jgi:ABC-type transport system substrate-binding protein